MMIHTVIFDIGGTLLGAPDLCENLSELFPGIETYDKIKTTLFSEYSAIGNGQKDFLTMEGIIKKTLLSVSSELNHCDVSMKANEVYYNTFLTQSYLYDDTISTLDYLKKKNIKMLVASDGDAELLYDEFKMHNFGEYFNKIFISSEVKAYKPNDQFVHALKHEINEPYENILFVGDSDCDILTGQKLGVKTVLKGSTIGRSCSPHYTISNLKELIGIID